MIELIDDRLLFSFPELHELASMEIDFQRTLRIPDDENSYYLPPGLGSFPLRHVDDYAAKVPQTWNEHGGVLLPMYQSEAMWISFDGSGYPFAVKIAAGKINAVTGEQWANGLNGDPQDYVLVPDQPWLDGFCVEKGLIRQFVAMPLGAGYTAEEQVTGKADVGGLQVIVYPMKKELAEKYLNESPHMGRLHPCICEPVMDCDMGLAPGGKMKQEIYEDEHGLDAWDLENASRCFVHLANSTTWMSITGEAPPHQPPTAQDYTDAGLPWFDYYSDAEALEGSSTLKKLKSVKQMGMDKGEEPLPENEPVLAGSVVSLGSGQRPQEPRKVRELDVT